MLRSIKDIFGYPIEAIDGSLGKVQDTLFDDRHWRLRYVVANTGRWLPGRKVLISPHHAKQPDTGWSGKNLPVELTKKQIEDAPSIDEHAPVSRQYEEEYARYYNQHQPYWSGPYTWGMQQAPIFMPPNGELDLPSKLQSEVHNRNLEEIASSHLRSARELIGYHIHAQDDTFGHIEDFIIDDEKWKLVYLVIDTKNWIPAKKSLIDIGWVESFNWDEQEATVSLYKSQIKNAPAFDPNDPINRDREKALYDYYGRPYHWEDKPTAASPH